MLRVNIGSGKGLLPDVTKPLPEPMLTNHQGVFFVTHLRAQEMSKDIYPWYEFEIIDF